MRLLWHQCKHDTTIYNCDIEQSYSQRMSESVRKYKIPPIKIVWSWKTWIYYLICLQNSVIFFSLASDSVCIPTIEYISIQWRSGSCFLCLHFSFRLNSVLNILPDGYWTVALQVNPNHKLMWLGRMSFHCYQQLICKVRCFAITIYIIKHWYIFK